jgi:hypothetical protein
MASWLSALPVAAMLLVAAVQRIRVIRLGQTPWKGGGFAMFADARVNVLDTALVTDAGPASPLALAESQSMSYARLTAAAVPTPKNLRRWGLQVLRGEWMQVDGTAVRCPTELRARRLRVVEVLVTCRCLSFDAAQGQYHCRVIRRATVQAPRQA